METWRTSVVAHRPGERDEALAAVAGWSRTEWNLAYPRVLSWSVIRNTQPSRIGAAAAFWKRAALLHTDIAMLEPTANEPADPSGSGRGKTRRMVRVPDGRFEGVGLAQGHWEVARVLLDQLPSPQTDWDVSDWYRATAAVLAGAYAFAELIPHLERARQLFPKDPAINFNLGCLYETLASSRVQEVLATLPFSGTSQVAVDSAGPNLRRAEEHFARAIAGSPVSSEAQVRLAAVRLLLGRPRDAAEALRPLVRNIEDSWVRYHALMFLGRAEEGLGRRRPRARGVQTGRRTLPRGAISASGPGQPRWSRRPHRIDRGAPQGPAVVS